MQGRRDLTLLVGGMGVSAVGTHVTFIALPLHLESRGPYVIAGVMMASLLPVALGGPLAGWLVDHFANRRLMVIAQLVAAGAAASMLLALDTVPVLLGLLAVIGAAAAVTSPAMAALLPKLTGESRATRGYSALATARSMGALIGLGLGGLLASGPGVRVALMADAASFLLLAGALTRLRGDRDPRSETSRPVESALDGLRWLGRDRVLLAALVGLGGAALLAVLVNVAEVYFVLDVLQASGLVFGLIAAAWAAGMIVGAKLAGRLGTDRSLIIGLFGCGLAMGAALMAPAAVPLVAVSVVAWFVGGACNAAQNVAIQGLVRSRVPDELRGRAFAGTNSAIVTATVLGTFVGGPATAFLGPKLVFVVAGAGTAVLAAIALVVVLPRLREGAAPVPATDRPEIAISTVVRTPAAGAEPPWVGDRARTWRRAGTDQDIAPDHLP